MEFIINHTPFEMKDISAKLFNSQFLSDVIFNVGGKQIYAHAFELMKRSVVFQQELESRLGKTQLIEINDYGYDVFYEFIRFMYTDDCNISDGNRYDLLKLAEAYRVIRLGNILFNCHFDFIEKFNVCVVHKYEITLNYMQFEVAAALNEVFMSDAFLSFHPDAVETILKLNQITGYVNEIDIVDALVHWIKHNSTQNQIQFDHLVRLIRFPTLSIEQLRDINTRYPELLSKSDLLSISGHKIFETDYKDGLWNCKPRMEFKSQFDWSTYVNRLQYETKFTISSDMMLSGFVFGSSSYFMKRIDITISSCHQSELQNKTIIQQIPLSFNYLRVTSKTVVISLGASIRIRPNIVYTIGYTTIDHGYMDGEEIKHWSRKPQTDLIVNAPRNNVHILEAHGTMFEIVFLQPDDVAT